MFVNLSSASAFDIDVMLIKIYAWQAAAAEAKKPPKGSTKKTPKVKA